MGGNNLNQEVGVGQVSRKSPNIRLMHYPYSNHCLDDNKCSVMTLGNVMAQQASLGIKAVSLMSIR